MKDRWNKLKVEREYQHVVKEALRIYHKSGIGTMVNYLQTQPDELLKKIINDKEFQPNPNKANSKDDNELAKYWLRDSADTALAFKGVMPESPSPKQK